MVESELFCACCVTISCVSAATITKQFSFCIFAVLFKYYTGYKRTVRESQALLQNDADNVGYNSVVPVLKHNAVKACGGHEAGPWH
jgi:hypothetical protein